LNAKVAAEEASKKTELEKKRKLLIEKKKRKESARADKELDSLFTNLYGTGKIDEDDYDDLPAVSSKLEGLEELLKGGN
jgi:hypothetical protein